MKVSLRVNVDGVEYEAPLTLVTPSPIPPIPPTPSTKPYVMLNCINWNAAGLLNLPDASELTYFVLPVDGMGNLTGGNVQMENKFITDVHLKGKKATFSVGGGSQAPANIMSSMTTFRGPFILSIVNRINMGYDGVTLDIENTTLDPSVMPSFINDLRIALDKVKPNLIIGVYTQPYQVDTVHARTQEAANAITWLSPMIYDFGVFTIPMFTELTKRWLPKVGNDKTKLLGGIAVNYPISGGGVDVGTFTQVLNTVKTEGWKGVGIWENTLYTKPWQDARVASWPVIQ